jgi:predicted O-methyltransferase YrrM
VSLPAPDCDVLRDALIREGASVVVEVGLAYAASALAIAEAVLTTNPERARHIAIDPFQADAYSNVGWEAMRAAGLEDVSRLMAEPSSLALPKLLSAGRTADAAFVDGSHRFHEVFLDLYYLRKIVRPGGLLILDDVEMPSVGTAVRYYELNLGFRLVELPGRLDGWRLPDRPVEPAFGEFEPFTDASHRAGG